MWTASRLGTALAIGGLGVALLAVESGPAAASSNGQLTFVAGVPVAQVRQIARYLVRGLILGLLAAGPGMTVLPLSVMIEKVLSPGLVVLVDR